MDLRNGVGLWNECGAGFTDKSAVNPCNNRCPVLPRLTRGQPVASARLHWAHAQVSGQQHAATRDHVRVHACPVRRRQQESSSLVRIRGLPGVATCRTQNRKSEGTECVLLNELVYKPHVSSLRLSPSHGAGMPSRLATAQQPQPTSYGFRHATVRAVIVSGVFLIWTRGVG